MHSRPVDFTQKARLHGNTHSDPPAESLPSQESVSLQEQAMLFSCLFEQMQEGVLIIRSLEMPALLNPKAEELIGNWPDPLPPDQWQAEVGIFMADGVTRCDLERNPLAVALQGQAVPHYELCLRNPTHGSDRWITGSATPLLDAAGQMLGAVAVFRDATTERQAEQALREEQNRFDSLVSGAAVGMWEWNIVTDEDYFSDRWCRLLGYEPDEIEPHFATWYNALHPDDVARTMECVRKHLELKTPFNLEYRLRTKSGKYKWFRASGQAVWNNQGQPIYMAGSIDDVSSYLEVEEELLRAKHALEERVQARTAELEKVNQQLTRELAERKRLQTERQELLRAMSEAEEEQRRHIAREVHDELGQIIVGMKLSIHAAQASCTSPSPIADALRRMEAIAQELSESVHHVASELRPAAIDDHGLLAALTNYWERWRTQTGIQLDWELVGDPQREFPNALKSTIYRSIQEALVNIVKHAKATHVSIVIEHREQDVIIIIEDNGCGFDEELVWSHKQHRLGLRGMRERVELVGGKLEIESSPGQGTTLILRLPLELHEEGS